MDKNGILAGLIKWLNKEESEGEHKAMPPSDTWAKEERKEHGGATGKKWAREEAKEYEKPKPGMLGDGVAARAAKSYTGRRGQIERALDEAMGDAK
jgi:hypothetical protein